MVADKTQRQFTIDLTSLQPDDLPEEGTGDNLFYILGLNKDQLPILIIDGYGAHVASLGFAMFDDPTSFAFPILIRTSSEQTKADTGYGSIWYAKFPHIVNCKESLTFSSNAKSSFDPGRFDIFARKLEDALLRVNYGARTALQAPNGYGKTTALHSLSEMFGKELDDKGILIAEIDTYGVLRTGDGQLVRLKLEEGQVDYSWGQQRWAPKIIIVDEAGREHIVKSHSAQLLSQFEAQGGKVLRVYPGNVQVPDGMEVVRID